MEYKIKKNNEEPILINFEGNILSDTLKDNYEYIYESMKSNNYDIRFEQYSILFELLHDNKVVGFATFFVPQASAMALCETYVLPEFESENLLLESFLMLLGSGANISIINPTRDNVEFLIKNNFATNLTDSLITSAIGFDMMSEDIIGNTNLEGIVPSTNIYDLNLCSPLFLYDISTPGVCEILYMDVLNIDDVKYNCRDFRKSVNIDDYFNAIKMTFLENSDEFNQKLFDLKNSLPKSLLDYDEIIGEGDELSDYFKEMVENGMIDTETALKVRNQLKKEYENGEVTDEGLALRVSFLLSEDTHEVDEKRFDDVAIQFDNFCPYCHEHLSTSNEYCPSCGYNISKTGTLKAKDIKN